MYIALARSDLLGFPPVGPGERAEKSAAKILKSISNQVVHKILATLFALFSVPCIRISPDRTHLHASFELGKELRSSQTLESTSPAGKRCFLGGTETSGGLTALRNPPGVFPMGPSTEETWNRLHNPETWLMLRRK